MGDFLRTLFAIVIFVVVLALVVFVGIIKSILTPGSTLGLIAAAVAIIWGIYWFKNNTTWF